MAELLIPGDLGNSVSVSVHERTPQKRPWEGWLNGVIAIRVGVWSGRYSAQFHEDDFRRFSEELAPLYRTLVGEAKLQSIGRLP
jgi:hypothetical protein